MSYDRTYFLHGKLLNKMCFKTTLYYIYEAIFSNFCEKYN